MDLILIVAGIVVLAVVTFVILDKRKTQNKYERVIVCYSEVVGNKTIEHDKQYIGVIDKENDIFKIKDIDVTTPVPPVSVFIYTKSGRSKIYMIKIDQFRYGFRIPSLNNQVFIQDRDDYGNLLKVNGKPKLRKFKWHFCDDVVEPDVKHWEQNIMEKLKEKHKTRADMLSKWIAPIMVGMILIAGIVTLNMTIKFVNQSLDRQMEIAGEVTEKAEENTGLINNLIKKVESKDADSSG